MATDWATISSLATAGGTLVLAVATFAAVRSSNRSARLAEVALQEQRRPILAQSRLQDPTQKIRFMEGNWVTAEGGRAAVQHVNGVVYLAISLRNVGNGIAVCQGWLASAAVERSLALASHSPLDEFRLQSRDLYVPANDIGMWQGALRNPEDPAQAAVAQAIDERRPITVELLYSDQVGLQRTVSRFGLDPVSDDVWIASTNRHWYLDWDGPRPESLTLHAAEVILREREAAQARRESEQAESAESQGSLD